MPDIIVTSPDSTDVLLAVEVKNSVDPASLDESEKWLRRYLLLSSCPVGLIVSPDSIRIYRNAYSDSILVPVILIGEYRNDLAEFGVFRPDDRKNPEEFELAVKAWLEQLSTSRETHTSFPGLRDAIATHVLPALDTGVIRAAGPREYVRRT